jgi:hypothetical protein
MFAFVSTLLLATAAAAATQQKGDIASRESMSGMTISSAKGQCGQYQDLVCCQKGVKDCHEVDVPKCE